MKIIKPSVVIENQNWSELLRKIETKGRICYKSEGRITDDSAEKFIESIAKRGHMSVLEHSSISVKFIVDRGVSHEIVRHRLASYSQESTRYVSSVSKSSIRIESERDIIEAYNIGLTMKKISELSSGKFTEWEVWKVLDKNLIERRKHGRRGLIDDNFFDHIDLPEKAYLLGFILADGNIRKDAPQITISQKKENSWYLLRMIRDFIQPEAKSLCFTSQQLWEQLIKKGIIPNKTYDFNHECADLLWDSIPENLLPDFLRGFLDGDGSIRFFNQKNKAETFSCNIGFNGSEFILDKIKTWLEVNFNYSPTIRYATETKYLHRMAVTNPAIGIKLCEKMYKNFIFPYGHPKSYRALKILGKELKTASWGDDKFNVILPKSFENTQNLWIWASAMDNAENCYRELLKLGATPQEARSVLPNSLKTELWMTANIREWLHFFSVRAAKPAHPQMRQVAIPLLLRLQELLPPIFGSMGYDQGFPIEHYVEVVIDE